MNHWRWIKITIILTVIVTASLVTAYVMTWRKAQTKEIAASMVTLTPATAPLGGAVSGELELQCPWGRTIRNATVEPGAGSVLLGAVQIRSGRESWGMRTCKVLFTLKSTRVGAVSPGKLILEISNGKTMDFSIPGFTSGQVEVIQGSSPELAEAIDTAEAEREMLAVLWLLAGLSFLAMVIGYIVMRHRAKAERIHELSFHEKSLKELSAIRQDLATGKHPVAHLYVRLTDFVRRYLEKRFQIAASTKTTDEFLGDLNIMPLPYEYQPFLIDFLEDAELIKFARREASDDSLNQAIDSAEKLVHQTAPEVRSEGGAK